MKLTHVTNKGEARMVNVGKKPESRREARASGKIFLQPRTIELIKENQLKKGDALAVSRVAGIGAAKQTSNLIPLCHNLPLDYVEVTFSWAEDGLIISAKASCTGKTGVEMEALTAVSVAALSVYDMCKAVDKKMHIGEIVLKEKKKDEV